MPTNKRKFKKIRSLNVFFILTGELFEESSYNFNEFDYCFIIGSFSYNRCKKLRLLFTFVTFYNIGYIIYLSLFTGNLSSWVLAELISILATSSVNFHRRYLLHYLLLV